MTKTVLPRHNDCTVAVLGLGYVGLPLAVELAQNKLCRRSGVPLCRSVIGFDINLSRLDELKRFCDRTNEVTSEDLKSLHNIVYTNDVEVLSKADVFIITVPTPINSSKRPDLTPLKKASETVGIALRQRKQLPNDDSKAYVTPIIVYESTVYPGATEEVCIPILEESSGLLFNQDFCCGYSPERINPGDKKHRLRSITKVTSGSTQHSSIWIDAFYGSIIEAGTHPAPSIQVAEAAKVIENTQRDLNIALINELSIIFRHMGIDTLDVLEAAGSKWNFLPFRPGLVGGHCIGVDPYYLTYKSEQLGYYPHVVLSGRRINDQMSSWLVEQLIIELSRKKVVIGGSHVLILGFTFKENCNDIRNTKVYDVLKRLDLYDINYTVVDPLADADEVKRTYGITLYKTIPSNTKYAAVLLTVAHDCFSHISLCEWESLITPEGVYLDLKNVIPRVLSPIRI